MDRLPKQIDNLAWIPTVPLTVLVKGGAFVSRQPVYVAQRGRDGETVYLLSVLIRSSEIWSTVQQGTDRVNIRNEQIHLVMFWNGKIRTPSRTTHLNLPAEALN